MIKSSNNLVCILSFFIYDFNNKIVFKIEWIIHTPALQQMYHEEWIVNLIDIPINKHILMTVLGSKICLILYLMKWMRNLYVYL